MMDGKHKRKSITYETLEKAKAGDHSAMQEVIKLFQPYMAVLSMEDRKFNRELFERLVQRLMIITWQFDTHYSEE